MAEKSHSNMIVISNQDPRFKLRKAALQKVIYFILERLKQKKQFVSFVFVTDRQIRALNKRFKSRARMTDVLAFPFSDCGKVGGKYNFLGEIIISPVRAWVQCRQFHTVFREEFLRYVCHCIFRARCFIRFAHGSS